MKKNLLYILGLLLFVGLTSCEDESADPTLSIQGAPSITAPADGTSLTLLQADKDNELLFTWTAVQFSLSNLPDETYKLQMSPSGTGFDL